MTLAVTENDFKENVEFIEKLVKLDLQWICYTVNGRESNALSYRRTREKFSVPKETVELKRLVLFTYYQDGDGNIFEIYFRLCYYNTWGSDDFLKEYHYYIEFLLKDRPRITGMSDLINLNVEKTEEYCAKLLKIFETLHKKAEIKNAVAVPKSAIIKRIKEKM